jgi:hypothetical protein
LSIICNVLHGSSQFREYNLFHSPMSPHVFGNLLICLFYKSIRAAHIKSIKCEIWIFCAFWNDEIVVFWIVFELRNKKMDSEVQQPRMLLALFAHFINFLVLQNSWFKFPSFLIFRISGLLFIESADAIIDLWNIRSVESHAWEMGIRETKVCECEHGNFCTNNRFTFARALNPSSDNNANLSWNFPFSHYCVHCTHKFTIFQK